MKFTAEIQQLGTFTYGTLPARKRWGQENTIDRPALCNIVIFQNLRSSQRLIIGGSDESHKIKLRDICKRRPDSEREALPSLRSWDPRPSPSCPGHCVGEDTYLERGYPHQVWRKCVGCQASLSAEGLSVKARIWTTGCGSTWRKMLCPDPLIPVLAGTVYINLGCTSVSKISPPNVRFLPWWLSPWQPTSKGTDVNGIHQPQGGASELCHCIGQV